MENFKPITRAPQAQSVCHQETVVVGCSGVVVGCAVVWHGAVWCGVWCGVVCVVCHGDV